MSKSLFTRPVDFKYYLVDECFQNRVLARKRLSKTLMMHKNENDPNAMWFTQINVNLSCNIYELRSWRIMSGTPPNLRCPLGEKRATRPSRLRMRPPHRVLRVGGGKGLMGGERGGRSVKRVNVHQRFAKPINNLRSVRRVVSGGRVRYLTCGS